MTTYRHILTINPGYKKISDDINELHKLVMSGYYAPGTNETEARAKHNILFLPRPKRINTEHYPPRASHIQKLLVQADVPGDWSTTTYSNDRLLGLTVSPPIPVDNTFHNGDHIEITALLNATRSRFVPKSESGTARGKRYPITDAADIIDWAATTFAKHGLELNRGSITVDKPIRHMGHKGNEKSGRQIIIDGRPITASGHITNPTKLQTALTTGIGRGRAYGTGLIRHRTI